jgi:parvulin-like peptidyl-prolyl isomerase
MQKEFEEAAFKLNKGEVSTMVDTASGVHLIQRSDPLDNHAWPQRLTFV